MRLAQVVGLAALTFTFGCVRFGYDLLHGPTDSTAVEPRDAAGAVSVDGAVADAGTRPYAGGFDASVPDAYAGDGATAAADGGGMDGSAAHDAGNTNDAAMQASMDAAIVAALRDAAVDGGPIALCPERPDALFCDGFEDPSFSRWSYTVLTGTGALARSTTRAHSDSGSLLATTTRSGSTNAARYGVEALGHQTAGDLWLRSYYYIPSLSVANPGFSTCVMAEIEPPYFGFSLLVLPTRVDIAQGDVRYEGTLAFPRNRWTCVELHVQIDASAGIFEAYLDGALAVRSPATDTLPDMGYTSVDVGIHYTEAGQGGVALYVDDVVASNTRVGCD